MKRISWITLVMMTLTSTAHASNVRVLDGAQITNGAATLTLPTTTDTILGRDTTDTLTNKSLSGASNTFTAIPASTALTGEVPVANGGTGLSTATTNGILFGNGTSAFGVTAAGSEFAVLRAGSGGVPAFGAINLASSVAVGSSILPVANGGTSLATLTANNVILGNGTSAPLFVAPGTSGNVLTSNGTTWTSAAPAAGAPTLNGSQATPQDVVAGTGISLSAPTYSNIVWVAGDGGAVTVTATPSITACTADGQRLLVIGTSNTNTVTLQDEAGLAGSDLRLNGSWVGGQFSVLELVCANVGVAAEWNEVARR